MAFVCVTFFAPATNVPTLTHCYVDLVTLTGNYLFVMLSLTRYMSLIITAEFLVITIQVFCETSCYVVARDDRVEAAVAESQSVTQRSVTDTASFGDT